MPGLEVNKKNLRFSDPGNVKGAPREKLSQNKPLRPF
jgi:hypothetical protein